MSEDTTYRGILPMIPTASLDGSNTIEIINQLVARLNYTYSEVEPNPDPFQWDPPGG
jgi:hypothetical protein|tara:strand:- start:71 stop:241 length:171 start_codon:yes stop_codon:yes gene_type:complete